VARGNGTSAGLRSRVENRRFGWPNGRLKTSPGPRQNSPGFASEFVPGWSGILFPIAGLRAETSAAEPARLRPEITPHTMSKVAGAGRC
jgi:hypothetical protein